MAVWSGMGLVGWRITRIIWWAEGHRGVEDSVAIAGYDSLLPSQTRLESVLRNLEISERWSGQADDGFAGISISLWKLWRHPGKGRRGTCRNRRYHPTAN